MDDDTLTVQTGCGCPSAPAPPASTRAADELRGASARLAGRPAQMGAIWDGLQGEAFTQAVSRLGYVRDPDAFRRYYYQNEAVLNDYFAHLDAVEVVAAIAGRGDDCGRDWLGLAAGVAGGAALTLLLLSLRDEDSSE